MFCANEKLFDAFDSVYSSIERKRKKKKRIDTKNDAQKHDLQRVCGEVRDSRVDWILNGR